MNKETKAVVSVAHMARMVGLSRQRFYQLMGTTFPYPLYHVATRRPFYPADLQQVCLDVRRRNCGIDGKPVLFYATGHRPTVQKPMGRRKPSAKNNKYAGLIEGLTALGLFVSQNQVVEAVDRVFPNGVESTDQGEVLKTVFLHLKRQDSGDSVGR
jgi:hypothetical protein